MHTSVRLGISALFLTFALPALAAVQHPLSAPCIINFMCIKGTVGVCRDGKAMCVPENEASSRSAASASSVASTTTISIKSMEFSPKVITVKKGTTVTWTNNDTMSHTVKGDRNGSMKSDVLATGQSYSYTFKKTGTFSYHCSVHPSMKALVRVVR